MNTCPNPALALVTSQTVDASKNQPYTYTITNLLCAYFHLLKYTQTLCITARMHMKRRPRPAKNHTPDIPEVMDWEPQLPDILPHIENELSPSHDISQYAENFLLSQKPSPSPQQPLKANNQYVPPLV